MSKLQELRLEARLSVSKLARAADVDSQTVVRAEKGTAIQDVKAYAIVKALSKALGKDIKIQDVDDLHVI